MTNEAQTPEDIKPDRVKSDNSRREIMACKSHQETIRRDKTSGDFWIFFVFGLVWGFVVRGLL